MQSGGIALEHAVDTLNQQPNLLLSSLIFTDLNLRNEATTFVKISYFDTNIFTFLPILFLLINNLLPFLGNEVNSSG